MQLQHTIKAIAFSTKAHEGQSRKNGLPYVTHPMAVGYIIMNYKSSKRIDEIVAACILHDTIEDTDTTFMDIATEFTPLVASLVLELTNDAAAIATMGKMQYQLKKMVGMSSYGLYCKLADRLHNISDAPTIGMVHDTLSIVTTLEIERKLTKGQQMMVNDIKELCARHMENEN